MIKMIIYEETYTLNNVKYKSEPADNFLILRKPTEPIKKIGRYAHDSKN